MLHCSRFADGNASVHSPQDYKSLQILLQSVQMLQTDTQLADAQTIATEHYICSESEREALTQKKMCNYRNAPATKYYYVVCHILCAM